MKSATLTILLATSMLAWGADQPVHRVEIKNLWTEIQQTPRLQVDGVKDKPMLPRYWLEIEAEIEADTTDLSKFIPEIKTHWYAIVLDKFAVDENGNTQVKPKLLKGEVLFRNVRANGGPVYLVAYIGPDDLEKMTGKNRPGEGDIEAAALVISGPGILADAKHAPGLQKATALEKHKWWSSGKYPAMDGLIVAKSKTPFAPLWTDRYPTEKPE